MKVPYVHSNFERRENDHYPTIDPRCVDGLVHYIGIAGDIVDCCAPSGSGIVDSLTKMEYSARCIPDAFSDFCCDWIVSNPPYKKGMVDKIIEKQISRIESKETFGVAMLLRTNFDHAKTRKHLFEHPNYYGQIKLCFRPYWTEDRKHSPIHNFVWHIWSSVTLNNPVVRYY